MSPVVVELYQEAFYGQELVSRSSEVVRRREYHWVYYEYQF